MDETVGKSPAYDMLRKAAERLETAAEDRDAPGGERSMTKAVAIFNALTDRGLSEADGWRFMVCLKMAREIQGGFHADDYIDLAGFSSLLGECCGK